MRLNSASPVRRALAAAWSPAMVRKAMLRKPSMKVALTL